VAYGNDDSEGLHGPHVSSCIAVSNVILKKNNPQHTSQKETETGMLTETSKEGGHLSLACNKLEQSSISFQSHSQRSIASGEVKLPPVVI